MLVQGPAQCLPRGLVARSSRQPVGDERAAQADYVAVPAQQTTPKPATVDWDQAGALFVAGGTAYAAVRAVEAKPGETVAVSAAAPDGVDAFIDAHGDGYVDLAIRLGVAPDRINTIIDFPAAERYGTKRDGGMSAATADVLAELAALIAAGELTVEISARYPIEQVREAYAELAKGHTRGKIVLRMR